MKLGTLLAFILFLGCAALFAQSQANTGTIEGTVTDPSDRAIPNAEVTLTNEGTNFTRVLTTDNEGRFRGLLLPLGDYKVTVKGVSRHSSALGWTLRWDKRLRSRSLCRSRACNKRFR